MRATDVEARRRGGRSRSGRVSPGNGEPGHQSSESISWLGLFLKCRAYLLRTANSGAEAEIEVALLP